MEDIKKEFEEFSERKIIGYNSMQDAIDVLNWIEQKIKGVVTEYKSKLVEGQSSGEWQSILLVNALRLLNDKERNELALSIIERTTPNLIDEACKRQREICARLHLDGLGYTPDSVTPSSNMILNAPSPKESDNG